jgi:hypothetical protein
MSEHLGYAPSATGIDWPALIAFAERLGLPVSRVDEHGRTHLIRTLDQLTNEWETES